MSMRLTRQQLRGTLADPTGGVFTAQVSAVVQEELKQRQVVLPQLPPWEEVVAQPAVEVLDRIVPPARSTPTFHRPSVRLAHLLELGRRSLAGGPPPLVRRGAHDPAVSLTVGLAAEVSAL